MNTRMDILWSCADIELCVVRVLMKEHYITLHYVISYATYTYSDQWCINKVIKVLQMRAWKGEFSTVFWKYQCLWVPRDWTEGNSTPSVRRTRNSARRTLVSTVEVHIENCWRISVSHGQAGLPRMSSCPTSTQDWDQLAPGAWARKAFRQDETWSEASVNSGGLEWCGPMFLQQVWLRHSGHVEVDQSLIVEGLRGLSYSSPAWLSRRLTPGLK